MFFKSTPKLGSYRIEEQYLAESNAKVYRVQQLGYYASYYGYVKEWNTRQVLSTLEAAVDMITKYKRQDKPAYHYP